MAEAEEEDHFSILQSKIFNYKLTQDTWVLNYYCILVKGRGWKIIALWASSLYNPEADEIFRLTFNVNFDVPTPSQRIKWLWKKSYARLTFL